MLLVPSHLLVKVSADLLNASSVRAVIEAVLTEVLDQSLIVDAVTDE